jgi:hypothetical protein
MFSKYSSILDSQDYFYATSTRTINEATICANNYEYSHIRSWLNDIFYNHAFTSEEKALIQTTTVDNSVTSTGLNPNQYACANTSDQVFLLSHAESNSVAYGLNTTASRQLQPSAYAKAQGVYTDTTGVWWLRSPINDDSTRARYVNEYGNFGGNSVNRTDHGVVPAMWISL